MDEIINRVAKSSLVTIDLEDFYPKNPRKTIDLSDFLEEGILLKEKSFREQLAQLNWSEYQDAYVAVFCSTDAILPAWASLLVASYLSSFATFTTFGSLEDLEREIWNKIISEINLEPFKDAKVIVKGCSKYSIPASAYHYLFHRLCRVVSSLMYGEACSSVPIFKKPK